ncbi:thymidine kinase, cytosolic [Falco biarmicus]|uniref:thymidine kinase, cytosolic n=1 Tax=Falco peregrinus TaxID=8954 RepID=UPI00225ED6AD|nr:thymidine kinase, cytosolic [Falco peregrinus]XP_056190144.1 thymidine kinase, cytosolic [Falco biarmicus]
MNCLTVPGVHPGSPSRPRGQIQVIFGPMFSGKSTELMRRVRRFQLAQHRCLLVKYTKDTRYCSSGVSTHDKNIMEALPACLLKDVYQEALSSAVIGIDEGQFFPDIVEFCEMMANAGKTVIVAALDGTFQRKAFGSILNLVPLAESVVKLNAVCMECYREASYTKRLGAEREVEVIGGADKYHSVCRTCYFRKRPQQPGLENKENMPMGVKQLDMAASWKIFAS